MSLNKTNKELAYLKDLYVAPDWSERFAELFDDNVSLLDEGRVLYVEANTGGHAIALQEKMGERVEVVGVDESEESIELARAKANVAKRKGVSFYQSALDALYFDDSEFDLVIGDGSLVRPHRLVQMMAEMVRVASVGATVALTLPTSGSFGEFFSIFWEALLNADLIGHSVDVENLITELPTVSTIEELAQQSGLEDVTSITKLEEFDFETGEEFLSSPLIMNFLLPVWLTTLPEETHEQVREEIARVIDESRDEMDFALSVKATLVKGIKS